MTAKPTITASLTATPTATPTAAIGAIRVSPQVLDFGTCGLKSGTTERTVALFDPKGNGTAAISSVSIAGSSDFSIDSHQTTCGKTLSPGYTCYIGIDFSPASKGSLTGTLVIMDNAANSPQTVELNGSGK